MFVEKKRNEKGLKTLDKAARKAAEGARREESGQK